MKRWKRILVLVLAAALVLPWISMGTSQAESGTWYTNDKGKYFQFSDGTYAKSQWIEYDGKYYYMNDYGYAAVSWMEQNNKWYYFDKETCAMVTGWFFLMNRWFYFGNDGVMRTGWEKIGKFWYYFGDDGKMVTGWQQINKKQYYFDDNGKMATGTVTIAGKSYTFDSEGVLQSNATDFSSANVGDTVSFGNYEQDAVTKNGKEAIEWIVLDKYSDGSYLLISRFGLDAKPYNDKLCAFTWDMCTLRTWLNGTFYNAAFSTAEKAKIKTTTVVNNDNFFWGTRGGSNTKDKVFLLSDDEAKKYFKDKDGSHNGGDSTDRACRLTAYAISQGGEETYGNQWWSNNCWYWLRSPGQYSNYAAYVYRNGYVSYDYDGIDPMIGVVRPAIVVTP